MATACIGAAIPTTPTARRSTTAIIITAAEDIAESLTTFATEVAPVTAVVAAFTTTPAHRHARSAATTMPRAGLGNHTGRVASIPELSAAITTAGNRVASRPAAAAALAADMEAVASTGAVVVTVAAIVNP
jgi:hypothetical protein